MKSILLIGLGNFGKMVAQQITEMGHQVMAVDKDEKRVNEAMPYVTDALIGDSTNVSFLKSLGINDYDACIVAIGDDFQSSLETTSQLKELGGQMVVAMAKRDVQAKFLLRNGADEVVNPEKQIARWTAIRYTSDHILDYIKLDDEHAIFEVAVPKNWVGKSIGQLDIRKKYGVNVMAVKIDGKMNLSVLPQTVFEENMTILVLAEKDGIQKCFRL
ncbi:MAG: TrkA family potassium uptake protein [Lachnospiraceae bacterium]|nr:TrkA family potassium uptake protein [Lachnospiraceae bacterium]